MRLFSQLYQKILDWAQSKYALYWLAFISFVESFILPYPPPDVLLAPMALKRANKAYQFALLCTVFSVLGGVVGYYIGAFLLDIIKPLLLKLHYIDELQIIQGWFAQYGIWIIIIAGFSPIPYKIFTIGAGVANMAFLPFIGISLLARGARFFLVAFFIKKFGSACDIWLKKYIDYLGYVLIIIIGLGVLYVKFY
ncbi:MAG: DedA family protein [Candidatus Thioglobus sp.]|nr:MAG: DedA family protein [Candidatus Thioglobus sp.]KAA0456336.1 MAG: DedA family protein [Candidatus Thioglobus sp.]